MFEFDIECPHCHKQTFIRTSDTRQMRPGQAFPPGQSQWRGQCDWCHQFVDVAVIVTPGAGHLPRC